MMRFTKKLLCCCTVFVLYSKNCVYLYRGQREIVCYPDLLEKASMYRYQEHGV